MIGCGGGSSGDPVGMPLAFREYARRYEVYLAQEVHLEDLAHEGLIKIGYTTQIAKRVQSLNARGPRPIQIVALLTGSRALERALHRRFARHRMQGEWFRPHAEILDYVRGLQGQVG